MTLTIEHFMWGYQPHFRINQKNNAKQLFRKLDEKFKPEVFLVGIRTEDLNAKYYPACVEPEQEFWIPSNAFDKVHQLSTEILKEYPENNLLHGHPIVAQEFNEYLRLRSIRDAIEKVIKTYPQKPSEMLYAASLPAKVEGYYVCTVLGLQEDIINSYSSLEKSVLELHSCREIRIATSLIDATILEFLENAKEELRKPDTGKESSDIDPEELIRSAGHRLMIGIQWRIGQQPISGDNLFRNCTTISSLYYEKSESKGRILLGKKHPPINTQIQFFSPIKLTQYRATRKLLELTSDNLSLESDSQKILGLSTLNNYKETDENVFDVIILGHHHWELRNGEQVLMRVQYGLPYLPKPIFYEQKLQIDLPRIFKNITKQEIELLIELVKTAVEEPHGTMLVITENANQEAKRLKNQGTVIEPCSLTPDLLKHLTPIDGAVILSPQGVCYAIGTILDGQATDMGDPGRGARFNSAVRYVTTYDNPCLTVIVSEDGGVDFFPNLKPPISRQKIDQTISELQSLINIDKINYEKYKLLLDWLEQHQFYLRKEDCDTLNEIIPKLQEKIHSQNKWQIQIIRNEFIPNLDLDESLYYKKE